MSLFIQINNSKLEIEELICKYQFFIYASSSSSSSAVTSYGTYNLEYIPPPLIEAVQFSILTSYIYAID